jgi:hypothetical protein
MERHGLRDTAYRRLQLGTFYLTQCLACSVLYSQLVNNIAHDGVSHATLTYNRLFRKTVLPFLPRSRW